MKNETKKQLLAMQLVYGLNDAEVGRELGISRSTTCRILNGKTSTNTLDSDCLEDVLFKYQLVHMMPQTEAQVITDISPANGTSQLAFAKAYADSHVGKEGEWVGLRTAINAHVALTIENDEGNILVHANHLLKAKDLYKKLPSLVCVPESQKVIVQLSSEQNCLAMDMLLDKFKNGGIKPNSPVIEFSEKLVDRLIDLIEKHEVKDSLIKYKKLVSLKSLLLAIGVPLTELYLEAGNLGGIMPLVERMNVIYGNRKALLRLSVESAWYENQEELSNYLNKQAV